MKTKHLILFLSLLFLQSEIGHLMAQETMVVGQVVNSADRTPIPNVNIYFKNTTTGVQSNEEGYFLIKTTGKETTLIFSAIGFINRVIHIKRGQNVGIDVNLEEENTLLREVFIVPGSNPALELMKKVRLMRKANDLTQYESFTATSTEQNLVLLNKMNHKAGSNRLFNQLKNGNLLTSDSSLVIPLYMAESKFQLTNAKKNEISKNTFSTALSNTQLLEKLLGNLETELNFYENTVTVLGKKMISPLANSGYYYYDYYLADSSLTEWGKQYEIHFRTKNNKNLAFFGKLSIDSASYALTKIEAELPNSANINYIQNLNIKENFQLQPNKFWVRKSEEIALNLNYAVITDSLHSNPQIFIKRSADYQYADSLISTTKKFAQSDYSVESINDKLNELNNTPILRTAKWIADVMFTGNMNLGKVDMGKIVKLVSINDIEGLRLTAPFKTNENLWKNVSIGGSVGYGFKNKLPKYSALAQFKLPGNTRRIVGINYNSDFRRIDYNYNDFLFRENPLITGDEDISSSVFALKSAFRVSERKEYSVSFTNDLSPDIESSLYFRSNKLFANATLPMQKGNVSYNSLLQQSVTFATRFSFDQKKYNDHMQRIYITNTKPVIYGILEYGKYKFGNTIGDYAKLASSMRQFINFDIGQFNYIVDAGLILGNVPYQLLQIPPGSETGGYSTFQFNMMNYMEYAADKYINLHTEMKFDGIVMNRIPLVKKLNLRELCSFHMAYGKMNEKHNQQFDFPSYLRPLNKPYIEVGVGFTNILKLFTLQYIWRLTDLDHGRVSNKGFQFCLNLNF